MEDKFDKAKKAIEKAVKESLTSQFDDFIQKAEKVVKKIINRGESMDLDLAKILGLIQGLHIIKKKKNKRVKKLVLALIIASITALSLGFTIKSCSSLKEGEDFEEKIKIFIKNLKLEELKNNPTVKKIRREIKGLMAE